MFSVVSHGSELNVSQSVPSILLKKKQKQKKKQLMEKK